MQKEYFFHRNSLDSSLDFDRLVGGERVEFEIEHEPQGPARRPGAIRLGSQRAHQWRGYALPLSVPNLGSLDRGSLI